MDFFDVLSAACSGIHKTAQFMGCDASVGRMTLNGHTLCLMQGNSKYLGSVNDVRSVIGCGDEGVAVVHTDGTYGFYDMYGTLKGGLLSRDEFFATKGEMSGYFNKPNVHPE